jgi:hypothetical protein
MFVVTGAQKAPVVAGVLQPLRELTSVAAAELQVVRK